MPFVCNCRRRPLYGVWRAGDNPAQTGWLTAQDGRLIVSEDPEQLRRQAGLAGTTVREIPAPITVTEWLEQT